VSVKFLNLIVEINNKLYRFRVKDFEQAFAFLRALEKQFEQIKFRFETQTIN
jgi:pterin-4a-carbinolamine dehydratase